MSRYKNATMRTYTFGVDNVSKKKCEVCLDEDGEIEVSYRCSSNENGYTSYEGKAQGDGHYLLESVTPAGRASLHRFPDSLILEGYWEEDDAQGMWRIELGKFADAVTGEESPESDSTLFTEPKNLDEELENLLNRTENKEEVEVEEDWDESHPRFYSFPLRYDWNVRLRLPKDLTRREGKRLASFVKALSSEY